MRAGLGSDLHRLVPGRRLMIGGIEIPSSRGEDAHSDGDVLLHAITDAVLGASAEGDIGAMFPDTLPETEGMSSLTMLSLAIERTGSRIVNIDSTVTLEKPKLRPYIPEIRRSIAKCAGIPISAVSVKAKTAEGLGEIGRGEAVSAEAVVLIEEQ